MDLFESAELIAAEGGKRKMVKKVVKPEAKRLIIKRGSEVIERKVEPVKSFPPVLKKKATVDMEKVEPESYHPGHQRAELGKRVFNERAEIMFILNRSYDLDMDDLKHESLESLKNRLNAEKVKEAKRLRFTAAEKPEEIGDLLDDFSIVSSVQSTFREELMGGYVGTTTTIGGRLIRIGGEPVYKIDEEDGQ